MREREGDNIFHIEVIIKNPIEKKTYKRRIKSISTLDATFFSDLFIKSINIKWPKG